MFGWSLSPVVCRRAHVLFTLFVFVYVICFCLRIVLCICCVFLHLVNPMLLVSLDCPFCFIDTSVFSNFYFDTDTFCILIQVQTMYK